MSKCSTSPAYCQSMPHRVEVFKLRSQGLTYAEIGARVGLSGEACRQYVVEALADLAEQSRELVVTLRDQRLKELRQLSEIYRIGALAGQRGMLDSYIKIIQREAQLVGADAPTKMQVSGPTNPYETMDLDSLRQEAVRRGIPVAEVVTHTEKPALDYRPIIPDGEEDQNGS